MRGSEPVGRGWKPAGMGSETARRVLPSSISALVFSHLHTQLLNKLSQLVSGGRGRRAMEHFPKCGSHSVIVPYRAAA